MDWPQNEPAGGISGVEGRHIGPQRCCPECGQPCAGAEYAPGFKALSLLEEWYAKTTGHTRQLQEHAGTGALLHNLGMHL